MLDTKQTYKIRKFVNELKQYRGRHTEFVTVYVPAGYDIIKIIQHLAQEQGTASNIKDKTTRLNVQDSLERMIRHLRLFPRTPENGLAAFAGNIASQEGKQDIKIWSIEPPVPLNVRMYRCDQTFVLGPLEDMMLINEVYGLIVMDNREATLGFLKGKSIQVIRDFSSSVPGKVKVGGWCLDPDTFVLMSNDSTKKISQLKIGDNVKSYDIKRKENNSSVKDFLINSKVTNIWKTKKDRVIHIMFPLSFSKNFKSKNISSSLDHLFFVFRNNNIKEIPASELKEFNLLGNDTSSFLIHYPFSYVPISKISIEKRNCVLIDIETTAGNFFANGILVHNSQQRYARLREEAANEFYKRIAEVANVEFAAIGQDLKGILIGGPGPTKETFANGDFLHNELKKKVIGTKDITYTDEQGLNELVEKAQDLLSEAEIIKEKVIVTEFFTLLSTNSDKVFYGANDVMKALEFGAVEKILLSEAFPRIDEFEEKANTMGTKVFIVSVETKEGNQLRELGGVGAILRYAVDLS